MKSLVVDSITRIVFKVLLVAGCILALAGLVEGSSMTPKASNYPWIKYETNEIISSDIPVVLERDSHGFSHAFSYFKKRLGVQTIISLSSDAEKTRGYMLEWFRLNNSKSSFISHPLSPFRFIAKDQFQSIAQILDQSSKLGTTLIYADSPETVASAMAAYRILKGGSISFEKQLLKDDLLFATIKTNSLSSALNSLMNFISFETFLSSTSLESSFISNTKSCEGACKDKI